MCCIVVIHLVCRMRQHAQIDSILLEVVIVAAVDLAMVEEGDIETQ